MSIENSHRSSSYPPNGREFRYVQIGDDAREGRTNLVRIPYWAHSVPALGWPKRKLSPKVSDKTDRRPLVAGARPDSGLSCPGTEFGAF